MAVVLPFVWAMDRLPLVFAICRLQLLIRSSIINVLPRLTPDNTWDGGGEGAVSVGKSPSSPPLPHPGTPTPVGWVQSRPRSRVAVPFPLNSGSHGQCIRHSEMKGVILCFGQKKRKKATPPWRDIY